MAAKDIGIGIASVMTSSSVLIPRADTVLTGFKYDPAAVTAVDGLTPYTNAAGGRATLADLATSKRLLAGPKIANSAATSGGASGSNYLLVTLSLGALPQYFSPSNFSFQLTLTVAAGP